MATFGFIVTVLIALFLSTVCLAGLSWPSGKNGLDGEKVFFSIALIVIWSFVYWVCPIKDVVVVM